jgi:hypothetical protein
MTRLEKLATLAGSSGYSRDGYLFQELCDEFTWRLRSMQRRAAVLVVAAIAAFGLYLATGRSGGGVVG